MLVYGDRRSREDPRQLARDLLADCAEVARGGDAHDAATRVFVASSELAQGLVDHAFVARGEVDDLGPFERLAARLTLAAARLLLGRGRGAAASHRPRLLRRRADAADRAGGRAGPQGRGLA